MKFLHLPVTSFEDVTRDLEQLENQAESSPFDPGDLKLVAVSGPRSGWLLCDGSAVSRSVYASLFAAIGTKWGAGNGTTTFNVPDLRGRVPVAAGTGSGLTARTVGQSGGQEAHALTVGELAAHTHGPGGDSSHFVVDGTGTDGSAQISFPGASYARNFTTGSAGSGTAHNNMQPFAVVNYLIKT